jgi:hypothetical protein
VLGIVNALDPDLEPFQRAGGKLIQWHEWDDAPFTPGWAVRYYGEVVNTIGSLDETQDFYRLFMMPGCGIVAAGRGHPTSVSKIKRLFRRIPSTTP